MLSTRWGAGGAEECTTTNTNISVSFTVYSSTPETWYKAILSVRLVLSLLRGVEKYKVSCVFPQTSEAWFGWKKMGVGFFLHFTKAYIIFLLPVKPKVFSTRSVVLVMAKRTKEEKSKRRNVVVPNTMKQTQPRRHHLVVEEVQVLGKVDHQINSQM